MKKFKKKYIGDRKFYAMVLSILVPMVLQNVVTNFVSMLDNIMVGQLGSAAINGVSISNQFVFIFNITIFGAIAGPGIFGAQFYGKGDANGQKQTLRFRLMVAAGLVVVFSFVYNRFMNGLLSLYISKDDSQEIIQNTLVNGREYLGILIWSFLPFAIGQCYASVIRECGETKVPMYASIAAVLINLVLDYGLIFGKFGLPEMGVKGAAIATVIAKTIETLIMMGWAHTNHRKNKYIVGLYKGIKIEGKLLKDMIKKGLPLLFNEFLWVVGVSIISQCYSTRGADVVSARSIATVISNIFGVVYIQIGSATAIILGNTLGAGKLEEAKDIDNKLLFFSLICSTIVGLCMLPFAYLFPMLYNVSDEIRTLAAYLIIVTALAMPMWSFTNACYFTLRSGGKTVITFLFDFVFAWVIQIPVTFALAYFTNMDIHLLFVIATYSEMIKVVIGYFMVRSNIWINNLVKDM